ncbi:DUF805 domain-containing protein [Phenylobacterium sp.]|uniref:DUF805 domain-containing protein n=1 Tax=Phenylobacterium sp. TaxID=1871053 RepID=UPI0025DADF6C|nr:DUF805 domain-containing protein [Phenylobacterium sp.]
MSDKPLDVERSERPLFGFLKGRAGRKEYWFYFGMLCIVGFLLSLIIGDIGSSISIAFAIVQIRRLHDFGRSGWWLLPVLLMPVCLPLVALQLGLLGDTLLVTLALYLAAYIWMGVRKGDAGDNRFGPPPASRGIFLGR